LEIGCLPYFHTWCGLSANLECRSETCRARLAENTGRKKAAKKSPSGHHRTTLSGYISKARIDNRINKKASISADRTARRQFQATGQPVSRTHASDAMTPRLPRYEAKCVQRRCFQCGSVPLRSDIKGTELPPDTTRKAIDFATTLPLRVFI